MDLIIILIVAVLLCAYGSMKGKDKIISLIASLYPAAMVYSVFPYTENLIFFKQTALQISISHFVIFLVFLVLIHLALNKVFSAHSFYRGGFAGVILISLATTGLLIAMAYHLSGFRNLLFLSPNLIPLFSGQLAYFIWLIIPPALFLLWV